MKKFLFATCLLLLAACGQGTQEPEFTTPTGAELIGVVDDYRSQPCLVVFRAVQHSHGTLTDEQKTLILQENQANFCARGQTPQAVWEVYEFPDGGSHYFVTRLLGDYENPE
jgi:hypothetical protein